MMLTLLSTQTKKINFVISFTHLPAKCPENLMNVTHSLRSYSITLIWSFIIRRSFSLASVPCQVGQTVMEN